jgi:2-C-methyl-D-erythritol 4-phosphate cytidylyltransferase
MSALISAVVVAAGRSQRMGFDKLLTPLAGQPLLLHTLQRIQRSPLIREIVLVVRPEAQEQIELLIAPLQAKGPIRLAHGGQERQDSVRNGLAAVLPEVEYVLIQDAARPFISAELVEKVFAAAQRTGAAVCGSPASDTMKDVDEEGLVNHTVDRSGVWTVQTPQIFRKDLLTEAYDAVAKDNVLVTDDTAAVERLGKPVRVVLTHQVNVKVTTPADWKLAETFLMMGEPNSPVGMELRKLLHDLNNQLTPMVGYTYLLDNEIAAGTKSKGYLENLTKASEKCSQVNSKIQSIVRELFPRKD